MGNHTEMAHREWASRPADERYPSLAAIHAAALNQKQNALVAKATKVNTLRVKAGDEGELILNGSTDRKAKMTNWAFGQLCARARIEDAAAPASYLSKLPAGLAAACLNEGLQTAKDDEEVSMLLDRSAGLTLRAMNGTGYGRIWNSDITARLLRLEETGPWQPAPAAFDGSRGLYMGDRDMFCFMVDNNRRIFESLPGGGLSRGFFMRNSEVGAASWDIIRFYFEWVCGNHRVIGMKGVKEIKVRHIGDADSRAWSHYAVALREYAEGSAAADEAHITKLREFEIGATKDEVLDKLFGLREPALSKGVIRQALDLAEQREDWYGNPRSAWGVSGAITEIARDLPNADDRFALDKGGKRVMELASF